MFIDLHVHSLCSRGVDSPARLLEEARILGVTPGLCDGVAHGDALSGVEIEAENKRKLAAAIRRSWQKFDYVVVHGGRAVINRAAVSDPRVDILAHPYLGRRDSGIDAVVARQATQNQVAIEIDLSTIIVSRGIARVRHLQKVRRILLLSRKYGFDVVVTSRAKSRYELRSTREAEAVLLSTGFTPEEVRRALEAVPGKILEKKRLARSEIAQGVRRVED
ncbi:RNase P subunit p30 family protein [Candidatus Pyrohabitans sp.]